jgi:hypothetical protein
MNFLILSVISGAFAAPAAPAENICYTIYDAQTETRFPVYTMCQQRVVEGGKVHGQIVSKQYGTDIVYSREEFEFEGGVFSWMTQKIPARKMSLSMRRVGGRLHFSSQIENEVSKKDTKFPERFFSSFAIADAMRANERLLKDAAHGEAVKVDLCHLEHQRCVGLDVTPLKKSMAFKLDLSNAVYRMLLKGDYVLQLSETDFSPLWIKGVSFYRRVINGKWESFRAETVRNK